MAGHALRSAPSSLPVSRQNLFVSVTPSSNCREHARYQAAGGLTSRLSWRRFVSSNPILRGKLARWLVPLFRRKIPSFSSELLKFPKISYNVPFLITFTVSNNVKLATTKFVSDLNQGIQFYLIYFLPRAVLLKYIE